MATILFCLCFVVGLGMNTDAAPTHHNSTEKTSLQHTAQQTQASHDFVGSKIIKQISQKVCPHTNNNNNNNNNKVVVEDGRGIFLIPGLKIAFNLEIPNGIQRLSSCGCEETTHSTEKPETTKVPTSSPPPKDTDAPTSSPPPKDTDAPTSDIPPKSTNIPISAIPPKNTDSPTSTLSPKNTDASKSPIPPKITKATTSAIPTKTTDGPTSDIPPTNDPTSAIPLKDAPTSTIPPKTTDSTSSRDPHAVASHRTSMSPNSRSSSPSTLPAVTPIQTSPSSATTTVDPTVNPTRENDHRDSHSSQPATESITTTTKKTVDISSGSTADKARKSTHMPSSSPTTRVPTTVAVKTTVPNHFKTSRAPETSMSPLGGPNCYTCTDQSCQSQKQEICSTEKPLCMNTLTQDSKGGRTFKKGCASKEVCKEEWWLKTSGLADCYLLDDTPAGAPGLRLDKCSFCCHGDGCNQHAIPDNDKMWYP